mmetsp:Transcript_5125/g.15627  ORF Transcript_5125/g.15627 Transcript_5125/m.15627 type:complete len:219 (+) Transcript_5125:1323-1979(+)
MTVMSGSPPPVGGFSRVFLKDLPKFQIWSVSGYRPVINELRLGLHHGIWTYALLKTIPSFASLSRLGVIIHGCPNALFSARMSSTTMKSTFLAPGGAGTGRGVGAGGRRPERQSGRPVVLFGPSGVAWLVVMKQWFALNVALPPVLYVVQDAQASEAVHASQHRAAHRSSPLLPQLKLETWLRPTFPLQKHWLTVPGHCCAGGGGVPAWSGCPDAAPS